MAAAAALEGVLVLAQARPRVLDEPDLRAAHRRPRDDEVLDERAPERLELCDVVLGGEHVDRVAHGVGGEQRAVVAVVVRGGEVAIEHDVDGDVGQLVAARGAHDLHQPDLGLAVVALAEDEGHASAPSVGAVAEGTQQQRDMVVLVAGDGEDDGDLGVERRLAAPAEVRAGVEGQAVAPMGQRRAVGHEIARAPVGVGGAAAQKLPAVAGSRARGRSAPPGPAARARCPGRGW